MVRKYVGHVQTRADAIRAYWYVNFIWCQNIGGVTVQRALQLLRQAESKVRPGESIHRKITSLTDEIVHNNVSPAEVDMDETASA